MMDIEESSTDVTNHRVVVPIRKKSWAELKQDVRTVRRSLNIVSCKIPTCFEFKEVVATNESRFYRIYFLSPSPITSREMTILYCDVPVDCAKSKKTEMYQWHQLLDYSFYTHHQKNLYTREEQLQMERKRMVNWGIISFDYQPAVGRFVFPACGTVFYCNDDPLEDIAKIPHELDSGSGVTARLNPQMCPWNSNLVAYVNSYDIWVHNIISGCDIRLTYARKGNVDLADDPLSAGMPSYVTQEEFNRFTGFWWQPVSVPAGGDIYRILYEEVDERDVDLIYLPCFGNEKELEVFRFPRPGTANSKSTLKIAQFRLSSTNQIDVLSDLHSCDSLQTVCPDMEYLARAGWTPDGRHVWTTIVSRQQLEQQLVLLPLSSFSPKDPSVDYFTNHVENAPIVQVIYEEKSDVWINIHEVLYFFAQENKEELTFLWASEETGYRHLYLVTVELLSSNTCDISDGVAQKGSSIDLNKRIKKKVQLTSGDWEVSEVHVWVNEKKRVVYFVGLKDCAIERHLYVVNLDQPQEPVRLTASGYSHNIAMNDDCTLFVALQSNVNSIPFGQVYQIYYSANFPFKANVQALGYFMEPSTLPSPYRQPELFRHKLQSGPEIYGQMFKPPNMKSGEKYPTVLTIYGGPEVQLVHNNFKGMRYFRQHLLCAMGYVVVSLDCRGSKHRGVAFEGYIKGRMGTVEIADQVEILQWLSENTGFIDLKRVAVHGWSYGGYLSLMALIQRPDVFKVAIAGAPVTSWNYYDTAYTERYMGMPDKNPSGYSSGSVLNYITQFPDEDNRLLIIHGLRDENVHFAHTSNLISALIKAGKPYQLQIYPTERHSLRNLETSEHYETTLLRFLEQHL